MYIILPCAGYGTRLKELTGDKPKSLLEINGIPILTRIITNLKEIKPKGFYIVTNNKYHEQFLQWRETEGFDHNYVKIINDGTSTNETRLGTLKDILLALDNIPSHKFLVYLGDNLITGSLTDVAKKFNTSNDNILLLKRLESIREAKKFGVIEIDSKKKIVGFEEKPENPKSGLISTGIYFLQPELGKKIAEYVDSGNSSEGLGFFVRDNLKIIPFKGETLSKNTEWVDIGSIETYNKANKIFK